MASKVELVMLFLIFLRINYVFSGHNDCSVYDDLTIERYKDVFKHIVPQYNGKAKGEKETAKREAGRIGVFGGCTEYTGGPYFTAISALKVGADVVYVVTTEGAAPVVKSYSPDLIVYPYLNFKLAYKISPLISKMSAVVIGPGLGNKEEAISLTEDIIETCKSMRKPLVIDGDGLEIVLRNPAIIKNYPSPGVIMTPNQREANKLKESVPRNDSNWFNFWGENVSILIKGATDEFHSSVPAFDWSSSEGGTGRRVAGQGYILSGSLGTMFGWAFYYCNENYTGKSVRFQSVATYAVSKFTRMCNSKAFDLYGRSMTASDMVGQIHNAFRELFEN